MFSDDKVTMCLYIFVKKFIGPGCSSVGYGATQDLDPFLADTDGRGLKFNNFSWNKGMKREI